MPNLTEADDRRDARSWRRWFTVSVAQFVVAGYFLMAYSMGTMLRAVRVLDKSVRQQTANADAASQRLERQTHNLLQWTRLLVIATLLLVVATIAILAGTIWPLIHSGAALVASEASSVRVSVGDQIWTWVERGSAIITIAGLIALYSQLRQMVRRPKLKVGFHKDPGGKGERILQVVDTIEIPVHWNPGDPLSEPTKLWIVVVNDIKATATATGINAEVRYPIWLVPEGIGDLKQPPGMDLWQLSKQGIELNPGVTYWLRGTFRIPRGKTAVQVHAIASMRDAAPINKMLTIDLKEIGR